MTDKYPLSAGFLAELRAIRVARLSPGEVFARQIVAILAEYRRNVAKAIRNGWPID